MQNVKLMKTKAGKGFKLVVDGKWVYTSRVEFFKMLSNKANACIFRPIEELLDQQEVIAEKQEVTTPVFSKYSDGFDEYAV